MTLPDLFDLPAATASGDRWPPTERFPLNHGRVTVGATFVADLLGLPRPLIVTAYAALDQVINFMACFDFSVSRSGDSDNNDSGSGQSASKDTSSRLSLRILFGAAPYPATRQSYPLGRGDLPEETAAYWLRRWARAIFRAPGSTATTKPTPASVAAATPPVTENFKPSPSTSGNRAGRMAPN